MCGTLCNTGMDGSGETVDTLVGAGVGGRAVDIVVRGGKRIRGGRGRQWRGHRRIGEWMRGKAEAGRVRHPLAGESFRIIARWSLRATIGCTTRPPSRATRPSPLTSPSAPSQLHPLSRALYGNRSLCAGARAPPPRPPRPRPPRKLILPAWLRPHCLHLAARSSVRFGRSPLHHTMLYNHAIRQRLEHKRHAGCPH